MTPDRVKQIRKGLGGLSQTEFGHLIGMKGENPDRNIREWEAGTRDVPGPSANLLEYLSQGMPATVQALGLPKHVMASADTKGPPSLVIRLWRPRFIMDARTASILQWIDQPDDADDERRVFGEAGEFLTDCNFSR